MNGFHRTYGPKKAVVKTEREHPGIDAGWIDTLECGHTYNRVLSTPTPKHKHCWQCLQEEKAEMAKQFRPSRGTSLDV